MRSANIQLYYPESKWTGVPYGRAFLRSILGHCLVAAALLLIASTATVPVIEQHNSAYVDVLLGSGQQALPDVLSKTGQTQLSTSTMRLAEGPPRPLSVIIPPVINKATVIKPARPNPTAKPVRSVRSREARTRTTREAGFSPTPVVIPGVNPTVVPPATPTTSPVHKFSFSELDGRACQAFYAGEAVMSSDKPRAEALWKEALSIMDEAIPTLMEETGNRDSPVFSEALRNTGRCYQRLEQYPRAREMFQQSADMYLRLQGPDCAGRGVSLVYLGDAFFSEGKLPEAEKHFLDSLPIYETHYGKNSAEAGWTHQRLANVYRAMNRSSDAAHEDELATQMMEQKQRR